MADIFKNENEIPSWELTKRILSLIKPYKKSMFLVIITVIGMEGLALEVPLLIRSSISEMQGGSMSAIWLISGIILGIFTLISLCRWSLIYAGHHVGYSIVADFRRLLYGHLQKLSRKFYSDMPTGDLLSRCTTDINHMEPLVAHCLPSMIRCTLILTFVPIIMLWLRWDLAMVSAAPVPILATLVILFIRKIQKLYRKLSEKISRVMIFVNDNVSGMNVIQAFTREDEELNRFDTHNSEFLGDALKIMRNIGIWFGTTNFLSSVGTVLVIFYGGYLHINEGLPIEDLVAFLLYLGFFYGPIMELNGILDFYAQSRAGAERVFRILDIEPDIADHHNAIEVESLEGNIQYENVSFRYLENIPVLKEISFTANPGQMVALVGPTGAGKSTMVSLLPRFYDVNDGIIKIDGYDIRDLSLRTLRKNISIVLQDVFLFNGTIMDNIAFGKMNCTKEEIIEAAKAANAHEFILELENGYDTEVGERGVKLSGGQKQRISIARAILKNSPILILDEATSSVDTETERLIQEALERLMENRTTLVIAHRLSTILHADKILVINNNRIAEEGSHEELIKANGIYRNLYEIQFRNTTVEHEKFMSIVNSSGKKNTNDIAS